jgi:hypothetical protein
MKRGYDLLSKRFGRLVVTAELNHPVGVMCHRVWIAVCDCGNYTKVLSGNLKGKSTRSCGCFSAECRKKKPYEAIYNRLLRTAKHLHGKPLTYENFLQFTNVKECHYCGAKIEWTKHFHSLRGVSRYNLDRKDNARGYSSNNLVVCCRLCNFTKADRFTYEQFVEIGKVIRSFRES